MGLSVGFSLSQFSDVLKIRNASGEPYVLIGGQAVNYWAERYLTAEPELKKLQPFTSEDIDFKGNRADVQLIARQLDLSPSYPPKVAMTALSGYMLFQIGNLKSSIEVVRRICGISDSGETPAVQAQWEGNTIRVLDPLLACKLELAATVSQERRRDVAHLRILVPCVRAFLAEFLRRVELGELPARGWLGAAKQVLKLTGSKRSRKIASKHNVDLSAILPAAAIARSRDERIERFREQQLDRKKAKEIDP